MREPLEYLTLNTGSPVEKPKTVPWPVVMDEPNRILVVEDDPDVRKLNAEILLRGGYQVDVACDGLVAWDILQRSSYDLVVTDNHMSGLSGIGLVGKIQAARIPLPVIMACGSKPVEPVKVHALLLKPYTALELLGTVKGILQNFVPPAFDCSSQQPG